MLEKQTKTLFSASRFAELDRANRLSSTLISAVPEVCWENDAVPNDFEATNRQT